MPGLEELRAQTQAEVEQTPASDPVVDGGSPLQRMRQQAEQELTAEPAAAPTTSRMWSTPAAPRTVAEDFNEGAREGLLPAVGAAMRHATVLPFTGINFGDIEAGAEQGRNDIVGLGLRLGGEDQAARQQERLSELAEGRAQQIGEDGAMRRAARGATRSVVPMLLTAGAGPIGPIVTASGIRGSQAMSEAEDAGLTGADKTAYITRAATIEALPALVFQRLGLGGVEKAIGEGFRGAAKQGIVQALKQAGKQTVAGELPEEYITAAADLANQKLSGVDPTSLSADQIASIFQDVTLQTLLMGGAVNAPSVARGASNDLWGGLEEREREAALRDQFARDAMNPDTYMDRQRAQNAVPGPTTSEQIQRRIDLEAIDPRAQVLADEEREAPAESQRIATDEDAALMEQVRQIQADAMAKETAARKDMELRERAYDDLNRFRGPDDQVDRAHFGLPPQPVQPAPQPITIGRPQAPVAPRQPQIPAPSPVDLARRAAELRSQQLASEENPDQEVTSAIPGTNQEAAGRPGDVPEGRPVAGGQAVPAAAPARGGYAEVQPVGGRQPAGTPEERGGSNRLAGQRLDRVAVNNVADLHRGFREVYGLNEEEAEAATALVRARAASLGVDADTFARQRISEVRRGKGDPILNQRGQAATTLDQQGTRLDAPRGSLAFDHLKRQWEKAHGERLQPQSETWQQLEKRAAEVDRERGTLYQDDKPTKESHPLVVAHNLSGEKLLHAARMGGLPVPSLAVTSGKQAMTGFGEISMLAKPDMLESSKAKTFDADVYSPRYPNIGFKADRRALDAAHKRLRPAAEALGRNYVYVDENDVARKGMDAIKESDDARLTFLRETGRAKGMPELTKDKNGRTENYHITAWIRTQLEDHRTEYDRWVKDNFSNVIASEHIRDVSETTGNVRKLPHNLDNVVKVMSRKVRDGEGFSYGVGNLRSVLAKQFRSVKQVQGDRGRIVDRATMEAIKKESGDEFVALAESFQSDPRWANTRSFGALDRGIDILKDVATKGPRSMTEWLDNPTPEIQQRAVEFLAKLRNLPTEYFETKVGRAVRLSEFDTAVVPDNASPEVIKTLTSQGVKIAKYRHGDEVHRQQVVEEASRAGGLLFQDRMNDAPAGKGSEKGAISFAGDGRAVIHALTNPDVSTAVHELGHLFRRTLSEKEQQIAGRWAGARQQPDGQMKWGRAAEEKFARGFERYLRDGQAPLPALRRIFDKLRTWLRAIYQSVKGTPIDVQISPEVRALFDSMLTPAKGQTLDLQEQNNSVPRGTTPATTQPSKGAADASATSRVEPERRPGLERAQTAPNDQSGTGSREAQAPRDDSAREGGRSAGVDRTVLPRQTRETPLAVPATEQDQRKAIQELDRQREKPETRSQDQIHEQARRQVANDPQGERRRIMAASVNGTLLSDLDTAIAQEVLRQDTQKVLAGGNAKAMENLAALHAAYRDSGTEQARALAIRRDPNETPNRRAIRMVTDSILTPPKDLRDAMQRQRTIAQKAEAAGQTEKASEARARLAKLTDRAQKRLERVRSFFAKEGIDLLYQGENVDYLASMANAASKANGTWNGALREYWINSILSGPRSFVVNAAAVNAIWKLGVNRFAEAALNSATGGRNLDAATLTEYRIMWKGLLPGLIRGLQNAVRSFNTEKAIFGEELDGQTQFDDHGPQIRGTWGRIVRIPTRLLLAADQFNKTWSGHVEVMGQAYRMARQQLGPKASEQALTERTQELVSDLESPAWDKAKELAEEYAFQGELPDPIKKAMAIRDAKVPGTDLRPLFYIMPFIKTPTNVIREGIKASPLGLARMMWKIGQDRMGVAQYEKSELARDAAQQLVSMAISLGLAGLAGTDDEDGLPYLTGTEGAYQPGKSGVQAATRAPYTLRIPGTKTELDYRRIEPFATWFGMVADGTRIGKRATQGQGTGDTIKQLKDAVSAQVLDKSMLKSIADVYNAFAPGGQGSPTDWARNFATSWIPNVIRAPLRDADDTVRESAVWGQGADYWAMYFKRMAQSAAPWTQTKRINLLGDPIEKSDGGPLTDTVAMMSRLISPSVVTQAKRPEDIYRWLTNWNNNGKNKPWYPSQPAKDYTVAGQRKFLTEDQYEQMQRRAGKILKERLATLAQDKDLALTPDQPTERQLKRLKALIAMSRKIARAEILRADTKSEDDEGAPTAEE